MERNVWKVFVAAALLAGAAAVAAAAEPIEAPGRVSKVTVYRGEALVSRSISVDVPAGLGEILVSDLPERVAPGSLFATAGEGVEVRAVRYRTRAVRQEPMAEARKLDAEIERVEREIQTTKTQQAVVANAVQYLGKLSEFVAPTAQAELTRGVLDAKTLESLTKFILGQQAAQAGNALELGFKEHDLTRELNLLKRRRAELPAGSSRTVREALLFIDAARAGGAEITLTYLVGNAGWEPSYNVRAAAGGDTVQLEYNAAIYQTSGEDWTDVEVTLSTASPELMADGPRLAPFWVSLAQAAPLAAMERDAQASQIVQLRSRRVMLSKGQRGVITLADSASFNWDMNVDASNLQVLEAAADVKALRRLSALRGPSVETMSVTYRLPGRASLASRRDRQFVRIADLDLEGDFYYVASPVLSDYVYRQVEITNTSDLAMLAGPASVYRDGGFVGKSSLPMVAQGQKFNVGFGLEPQLRASRELVEKTEDTMGANKEANFKYRISLENYMAAPVTVRLYDRLPHPAGDAEIRVSLGTMSDELSDEARYLETERPKGILRWDIEVPARASGADARKVEYAYRMEFDRRLNVTTPVGGRAAGEGGALRKEFEALNVLRGKAH